MEEEEVRGVPEPGPRRGDPMIARRRSWWVSSIERVCTNWDTLPTTFRESSERKLENVQQKTCSYHKNQRMKKAIMNLRRVDCLPNLRMDESILS